MSISFYIANRLPDGGTKYAYRCDCSERWCAACDEAYEKQEPSPAMFTCDNCTDVEVNMANVNAAEWMRWIGIPCTSIGEMPAKELAALCRRRLWDEQRNYDPALDGAEYKVEGGPMVIMAGRRPNYLRSQTELVLRVCEKAGERLVAWA